MLYGRKNWSKRTKSSDSAHIDRKQVCIGEIGKENPIPMLFRIISLSCSFFELFLLLFNFVVFPQFIAQQNRNIKGYVASQFSQ
jgi:hypothetical protein